MDKGERAVTEYIPREWAIYAIRKLYPKAPFLKSLVRRWQEDNHDYLACETAIENVPASDVAIVRHGHWTIDTINEYKLANGSTAYEPVYHCSACRLLTESYVRDDEPQMPLDADFPKYCPHCGAKMDL